MEKITLTPNHEEYLVLEADVICPDIFAGKSLKEIAELEVWEGNTTWPLSKFFHITGSVAEAPEDQGIVVNGNVPRVKYIGAKMTAGAVLCQGDVDMYCGAWMKGGRIRVKGNADAFAGIQMEGGELIIEGNAGDYLGGSYRGDWRGMKGGTIRVKGNAGYTIGDYIMGGTIVIEGNVNLNAGIHAGKGVASKEPGGKIIIYGNSPGRVGGQMIKGSIYVLGTIEAMMPGFSPNGEEEIECEGKPTTFKIFNGDHAELGKGKLYVKV